MRRIHVRIEYDDGSLYYSGPVYWPEVTGEEAVARQHFDFTDYTTGNRIYWMDTNDETRTIGAPRLVELCPDLSKITFFTNTNRDLRVTPSQPARPSGSYQVNNKAPEMVVRQMQNSNKIIDLATENNLKKEEEWLGWLNLIYQEIKNEDGADEEALARYKEEADKYLYLNITFSNIDANGDEVTLPTIRLPHAYYSFTNVGNPSSNGISVRRDVFGPVYSGSSGLGVRPLLPIVSGWMTFNTSNRALTYYDIDEKPRVEREVYPYATHYKCVELQPAIIYNNEFTYIDADANLFRSLTLDNSLDDIASSSWTQSSSLLQVTTFSNSADSYAYNIIHQAIALATKTDIVTPEDPWGGHYDDSDTSGGGGTFDSETEDVDGGNLPDIDATSKMVTLYAPNITQIDNLAEYLWQTDITDRLKSWLFGNIMDAIVSLHFLPVNPQYGTPKNITVGNIDSGVSSPTWGRQFISLNCGSIEIPEYYGSYLDYSPYTKIEIYLPYCGSQHLVPEQVLGKTLSVTYRVDVYSGSCVAIVKAGGTTIGEFPGKCSVELPLNSRDFAQNVNALSSVGVNAALSAVGGNGLDGVKNVNSIINGVQGAFHEGNITKNGHYNGPAAFMGSQKPYVTISRPRAVIPSNYAKHYGYASNRGGKVSDFNGYLKVSDVKLNGIPATINELNEIEKLMKEGIIV